MAAVASPQPVSSPINSPFTPRLPSKSPGLPPPVTVPRRRPVAAPPTAAATPTLSVPTPTSSLPMPTSPDRSPSPAASISSLLSAYTNNTAESTPRSSDLYSATSPTIRESRESPPPPPPPLKDASRVQIQTHQPPVSTHTASPLRDSAGSSTSPQDGQLWRRRSLKKDKHIAVPELNLVASNGSTVNPAPHHGAPTSQPPTQPLPPPPSPLQLQPGRDPPSRNANGGLPGRNIRPVLDSAEPALPQIEVNNMGQEASNLKQTVKSKKDTESPKDVHRPVIMSPAKSLASVSPLSAQQRLPTPDYGAHDIQSPQLDVVVSPVSPALTPELPGDQKPPPPIPRKTLGPALEPRIRHAKSSPNLAPNPSNSALNGARSPGLPASPAPGRDRGASHSQVPPLSAGARRDPTGYPDFYPPPPPVPASYYQGSPRSRPQTPTGRGKPVSETGSEVTVKAPPPPRPEWMDYPLREPDPNGPDETNNPGAALFPRNWYTPLGPEEVLDAKPLEAKHFRCITNHRIMTAGKQKSNPIACRLCGHKDRNAECYICSSCHLNVCSGCTGHLRRFKGDLESVLQAIEEKKAPKQLQPSVVLQNNEGGSPTAEFLDHN
ncbi:hypothetical protein QBC43DRAFT_208738 [Cladorrhinum sp. PSN259]|nr:hypothetical protein QBC43DRAFT_208738 [Cladorrhinum sp. PSN259]